jgi:hypothetical protein
MRHKIARKALVALLLATVGGGFGCNPLLAPAYFLGIFNNTTLPPEFEFYKTAKAAKKKSEIKVVILPEKGSRLAPDYFGSEHDLAKAFETKLAGYFTANKEKVKIVPVKEVEAYKRSHPDWKTQIVELGKHFNADYVFDLELESLSLKEPRSFGVLQGRATVNLTIVDVAKANDDPVFRQDLPLEFPKDGRAMSIDGDSNVNAFKYKFFDRICMKLCHMVTAYPTEEKVDVD